MNQEVDLSDLKFEELCHLRLKIEKEIENRLDQGNFYG